MFRTLRRLIALALLLCAGCAALVAWGALWPAPAHAPRVHCPRHTYDPCTAASGRVLYHTAFGRGRRAHVVLLSARSITLPGIVILEMPRYPRTPPGLGFGDWLSVDGQVKTGSHHEHDLHVRRFATMKIDIGCGVINGVRACRRHRTPR